MKKELIWGYLSQFLQYGAALLILPLLLRKLSSAELGIWYVFLTINNLIAMLDMGFTPTLARNVSYVLAGAKKLCKDGHDVVGEGGEANYDLLLAVIRAAKLIFLGMTGAAVLVLGVGGTWFVWDVSQGQVATDAMLVAWATFAVAMVVNLYFKYFTPLLQGRGLFAAYYKALAISNLGFIAVAAILLELDWGLAGVSVGFLASAVIGRILSGLYFYDKAFSAKLASAIRNPIPAAAVVSTLWSNSWRLGLVVVGAFLTLRANTLLASACLDLPTTAIYGLTLQVFTAIMNVCMVAITIQQQKLAALRVADRRDELFRIVSFSQAATVLLYVVFGVIVVLFGNDLISLVGSQTQMLSGPLLGVVAVMFFLELNHSSATVMIVTRNTVPFWLPSIVTGVMIVSVSVAGLRIFDFGVWWLVAAQFVCQAVYNNWRWPQVLAREFGRSYFGLLRQGCATLVGMLRCFVESHRSARI